MRYLSLAEILFLHKEVITSSGGMGGVRDLGGLESAINQPRITFDQKGLYPGLPAMRHTINWIPKTEENKTLTLYQTQVADKEKRKLYSIFFTTLKEDFERSKVIFDNIANTFRI